MGIETYAPIVIVTLNRINHLKRCITSLQVNTGAKNSDLFIALDYPPTAKYVEGYKKVCDYLETPIEGFKSVNIIRRDTNYGPIINSVDICKDVLKKYDRIILLEDDNELSPCFLDFCNKGLELYKDDDSIIGLNASSYVWCGKGMVDNNSNIQNVKKRQLTFHAYATWRNEYYKVTEWCESYKILEDGVKIKYLMKLRNKSRCFFYAFIENVMCNRTRLPWVDGKIYKIDQIWDYYMLLFDKYFICPQISLIRDLGCDGSGANYTEVFENMTQVLSVKLDTNPTFDSFTIENIKIDKHEIQQHDIHTYNRPKSLLHAWYCCWLLLLNIFGLKKL